MTNRDKRDKILDYINDGVLDATEVLTDLLVNYLPNDEEMYDWIASEYELDEEWYDDEDEDEDDEDMNPLI